MLTNAKRILIETNSTEVVVLHMGRSREPIHVFCPVCDTDVAMLDLDSAVSMTGRGANELINGIDLGSVHSIQTAAGHLLLCGISIGIRKDVNGGSLKAF